MFRRGDYEEHCYGLEGLMAPMQGWYSLREFLINSPLLSATKQRNAQVLPRPLLAYDRPDGQENT